MQEHRNLAAVLEENLLEVVDEGPSDTGGGQVDMQRRVLVGDQLGALQLQADDLGRLLTKVDTPLDADDGVIVQEWPVLMHGAGEDHDLHGGVQVLEHEGRHELTPLGVLPLQGSDDATDPARLPVPKLSQAVDRAVGVATERPLDAHERMVADVEAEHLLLEGQALALVELVVGNRYPFVVYGSSAVGRLRVPEQVHDPQLLLPPAG